MKLFLTYLTFVLGIIIGRSAADESALKTMKFGDTINDYVSFKPDMKPFSEAFSLCSWIRKMHDGGQRTWFSYATSDKGDNEIWLSDSGYVNYIFQDRNANVRKQAHVTKGEWYHYCECWDFTSKTADIYHNGKRSGSMSSTGLRKLGKNGNVVLGQDQDIMGGRFVISQSFGGEIQKLNMFSKKLSSSEVSEMYSAGRCSDTVEKSHASRELKWEDILKVPTTGDIRIIDLCTIEKMENLEKELADVEGELKKTQTELLEGNVSKKKLSKELDQTMNHLKVMTAEVRELEESLKGGNELLSETEAQLDKAETKLAESEAKLLKSESRLQNTEILLYTSSFYNKVLTDELLGTLDADWEKLSKYLDFRLPKTLILTFKIIIINPESLPFIAHLSNYVG